MGNFIAWTLKKITRESNDKGAGTTVNSVVDGHTTWLTTRRVEEHGSRRLDERMAMKERSRGGGDKGMLPNDEDEIGASWEVEIIKVGVARHCRYPKTNQFQCFTLGGHLT